MGLCQLVPHLEFDDARACSCPVGAVSPKQLFMERFGEWEIQGQQRLQEGQKGSITV